MIDKSFIEKILEMAPTEECELHGIPHFTNKLHSIKPPQVAPIAVKTLQAVVDYCDSEIEVPDEYIIHVVDHERVELLGPLDEKYRVRETLMVAKAFDYDHVFGHSIPADKFIIAMQAKFIQDETTEAILKRVGNMTTNSEVKTRDDGVTQTVEAKTGLAKTEYTPIPNPVILTPYRTFLEVDQPSSRFVLRLDTDHRAGLYEADGGAWKINAIKRIKDWLSIALAAPDSNIQILA